MFVPRQVLLSLLLVPILPGSAPAQSDGARRAAATITEADVRRRIEVIAHDSMGGRDTPSRGLDLTATWVAAEFARLGLAPGGDSGHYIQRYAINVAEPDPDSTFMEFNSTAGTRIRLRFGHEAMLQGAAPAQLTRLPMVLLAGAVDSASVPRAEIEGRLLVWVVDGQGDGMRQLRAGIGQLAQLGAAAIVAVMNGEEATRFGSGTGMSPVVRLGPARPGSAAGGRFFALVPEPAIVRQMPEAAGRFAELRASPTTVVQPLPDWEATVIGKMSAPRELGAPNVVGILEGADPELKNEYVVISAHMDHVGSRCRGTGPTDAICNGADDDASGTVGVVELAEALAHPGARPKRSVIFLTVSAEERGLWGSRHFASNPPVNIGSVVANLNMDMIGRNWADTIVAIGKEHSDLGRTVEQVAAANPDLRMAVIDDLWPEENLYGRSDHYNFAVRGVPVLFFTSGLHDDYHAVTDSPEKIDAEKEARLLRLVFHLTRAIADRPERPQWNKESYDRIVGRGRTP